MKITAGIANADQLTLYREAGADEFYCGYIPDFWPEHIGASVPLNRREVLYCPVQIGGRNELRLLRERATALSVPVALTFNAPCYPPTAIPVAVNAIEQCLSDGFDRFIVADPALMQALLERGLLPSLHLHISGEAGEINRAALEFWRSFSPDRIIFHRKVGLSNMASLIRSDRKAHPDAPLEYEAFAMNESCHFNGAFCSAPHCDEYPHLCHLPWRLAPVRSGDPLPSTPPLAVPDEEIAGHSGCGVCSLPALARSGITTLKVVGRGADTDEMIRDIHVLRKALTLAEQGASAAEIRLACFPDGCSGNCYYL